MWNPTKRRRFAIALVILLITTGLLGVRSFRTRRRARIHDFHASLYQKRADRHREAARDCEEYTSEALAQVAREYRAEAEAEARRAEYHARLGARCWHALIRPWVILEPDPPPPTVP